MSYSEENYSEANPLTIRFAPSTRKGSSNRNPSSPKRYPFDEAPSIINGTSPIKTRQISSNYLNNEETPPITGRPARIPVMNLSTSLAKPTVNEEVLRTSTSRRTARAISPSSTSKRTARVESPSRIREEKEEIGRERGISPSRVSNGERGISP